MYVIPHCLNHTYNYVKEFHTWISVQRVYDCHEIYIKQLKLYQLFQITKLNMLYYHFIQYVKY